MLVSLLFIIIIAVTHPLGFQGDITTFITPGCMLLSAIFGGVSAKGTGDGVWMNFAAAGVLGPATGILIDATTAASEFSRMVVGRGARFGSVCHS